MLPSTATDQELQHIRNALPDKIKVQRIDERLSALGNCIATNDHVAQYMLISIGNEDIVCDVLGVEALGKLLLEMH